MVGSTKSPCCALFCTSLKEFPADRDETSVPLPTGSIRRPSGDKHQAAANDSHWGYSDGIRRAPQPKGLAAKLHQICTSPGLTKQQMVKELKGQKARLTVYPGNISRSEQGLREPPLLVLLAYAKVARIPIDVLVDCDPELTEWLLVVARKNR